MNRLIEFILLPLGICAFLGAPVHGADFPLKLDSSNRFFMDQAGVPFLVHIDSPWSLIIALNNSEVNQYLADRQAKGFNALIVNLIEHQFHGDSNPNPAPINRYGQGPFLTPGDFSTPNEAYFTNADWVIDQAAARGMVVLLAPCYLGYPGTQEGWYNEVLANGDAKCRDYGRWVGNRYKNKPNLIWLMGGDRNPDAARTMVDAMADGIKEFDTNHLFTAHCIRTSSARSQYGSSDWLSFDTAYTLPPVYHDCLASYTATPPLPYVLIEAWYENEHGMTPLDLRRQEYSAYLSGAGGQAFGNLPVWGFFSGWQSALDSVGANDMKRVKALFLSRPWTKLAPDTAHVVLTAGYGSELSYVPTARANDGSTVIAYLPSGGAVTVDLTKLSGTQVHGWWFNPSDGSVTNNGTFPTSGSQVFNPPSTADWVLVLDDAAEPFPPPGSPLLSLSAPAQNTGAIATNGFRLLLSAGLPAPGALTLQYTTNLSSWQFFQTVQYTDSPVEVLDAGASNSLSRFYRAVFP